MQSKDVLGSAPALVISRLILGGVFVYAAWDKIVHPDQFAQIVLNYKLLPDMAINLLAIFLPWLEMIAGVALILGIFPKENAAILGGLLLVFILAIGINLARGLDFDCGCFSTSTDQKSASYLLILRDIALFVPAVHVILFSRSRRAASVPTPEERLA